jgi:hypothetical protein
MQPFPSEFPYTVY